MFIIANAWGTALPPQARAMGSKIYKSPKKGQPKAWLRWMKATSNGWCRECQAPVKAGGLVRAWVCAGQFGLGPDALSGQWLGRVQNLCGSYQHLGEANRTAEMARQAREKAEREALWAEVDAKLEASR